MLVSIIWQLITVLENKRKCEIIFQNLSKMATDEKKKNTLVKIKLFSM